MITLADMRNSRAPARLGVCSDDPRLVQWLNAAQRRLLTLPAAWEGAMVRYDLPMPDGRSWFALPPGVETIRGAWPTCDDVTTQSVQLRNRWYYPSTNPMPQANCSLDVLRLQEVGDTPTITDFAGQDTLSVSLRFDADAASIVTVRGLDTSGDVVRVGDCTGEPVTTTYPGPVSTTTTFNTITSISKPQTTGEVEVWNSAGTVLLAKMFPEERSSLRTKYEVLNPVIPDSVTVLCKLKHRDVVDDCDTFLIRSMDALENMAMSVKRLEEESFDASQFFEAKAKEQLDSESRNRNSAPPFIRSMTVPRSAQRRTLEAIR